MRTLERFAAIGALTYRGNTDKEFVSCEILGLIIKAGHESILEHINLTYSIKRISRALLQEVSRHRHISLSVESTRHTLRKQLENITFFNFFNEVPEEYLGLVHSVIFTAATYPNMPEHAQR